MMIFLDSAEETMMKMKMMTFWKVKKFKLSKGRKKSK